MIHLILFAETMTSHVVASGFATAGGLAAYHVTPGQPVHKCGCGLLVSIAIAIITAKIIQHTP